MQGGAEPPGAPKTLKKVKEGGESLKAAPESPLASVTRCRRGWRTLPVKGPVGPAGGPAGPGLPAAGTWHAARSHCRVGGCQLAHSPSWRCQPGSAEVKAGEGPGCSRGLRAPAADHHGSQRHPRGAFTPETCERRQPSTGHDACRADPGGGGAGKTGPASCSKRRPKAAKGLRRPQPPTSRGH